MNKRSAVIISLHSPREKVWGLLVSVHSSGVTVRGIDLSSFEDWTHEAARGGTSMSLSTVFFPMHRVERILLDEGLGDIPSMAQIFASRVGKDVWSYLDIPAPNQDEG